jgi:hypothetical protein
MIGPLAGFSAVAFGCGWLLHRYLGWAPSLITVFVMLGMIIVLLTFIVAAAQEAAWHFAQLRKDDLGQYWGKFVLQELESIKEISREAALAQMEMNERLGHVRDDVSDIKDRVDVRPLEETLEAISRELISISMDARSTAEQQHNLLDAITDLNRKPYTGDDEWPPISVRMQDKP